MLTSMLLALILGCAIGAVAGYIGSLMLTRRMALMGGALGHLALPGVALALLYDFDVSLGALLFLTCGVAMIGWLEHTTRLHPEALTAVVFSGALATAFLFLPEEKTEIALLGDISQISPLTVSVTLAICFGLFRMIKSIYAPLVLSGISTDLAQTTGLNPKRINAIYLICIAITVALGVRIVGGLMTAALLAIPACTAKNLSQSLAQYASISSLAGAGACVLGILAFGLCGIPAGPAIIITSVVIFLLSVLFRRLR